VEVDALEGDGPIVSVSLDLSPFCVWQHFSVLYVI